MGSFRPKSICDFLIGLAMLIFFGIIGITVMLADFVLCMIERIEISRIDYPIDKEGS